VSAVITMSPQPAPALETAGTAGQPGTAPARPGWRSTVEGLRFVRRSQPVQGAYLIDVNAMVFGMPRALFPALAATVFGGGATTVGLLYSAPGVGALLGALTSGWVGRIRRQGLAVVCAVLVWGLSIAGFGVAHWLPLALVLLAVAGWADVLSAVFRNTIIQFAGPDGMRGRLMGVQMAVVAGGPRLGDLEAGAVATAFGDTVSVVSGGLACVAGALVVAWALPGFTRLRSVLHERAEADVTEAAILPWIPRAAEIDQEKDKGLMSFSKILSENCSIHNAATWILKNEPWDFMAVYYNGIDHFCHGFMHYHPPRMEGIPEDRYEIYKEVVNGAYRFHDMMLETLLELAGPDATVLLVSDHGFHSDHLRPRGIPAEPAGPAIQHRPYVQGFPFVCRQTSSGCTQKYRRQHSKPSNGGD